MTTETITWIATADRMPDDYQPVLQTAPGALVWPGYCIDYFNDIHAVRKELRRMHGVNCPRCALVRPKTFPSILLPRQRCKVDDYRDPPPTY